MADSQINEPPSSDTSPVRTPAAQPPQESMVCDCWQQMVQAVMGIVLLLGALAMVHYYAPTTAVEEPPNDLQKQVHELTAQVEQLKQDQAMPAVVLNRYRNSIGYIYGVYQVGFPNQRPVIRARVSGTGFLVGNGLARHQPSRSRALVRRLRSPEAHRSGSHRNARKPGSFLSRLAHARESCRLHRSRRPPISPSCMLKIPM